MSLIETILSQVFARYQRRVPLGPEQRAALLGLPMRLVTYEPGKYLVREGSTPLHSCLVLKGLCYRHKLTTDGARQIVSIHVPGDFVDLERALLSTADHNIQALTRVETAVVSTSAIVALIDRHPQLGRAMWIDTLIDGSIFREWIVNIGRRDARERLAHILCEFALRLEGAGVAASDGYEFPMSQEQLADATGLTPVHVNRTLRAMEADGLLTRDKRFVAIPDWGRLRQVAGFSELYLHLDQGAPDPALTANG
ncbi:MAG: Crp/Fnr family transcriptional regulator [Pseudomonadota bacterium]|nr:Crp/Fnr family transcriptional regulator [Pseudomonadota bacterium]